MNMPAPSHDGFSPAIEHDFIAALDVGEQSGSETFSKYRYQVKLALQWWLYTCVHSRGDGV
jgi:hypothetical protein